MTRPLYSGRAALVAFLATSVLVACETKHTELTEAVGPIAFNFAVGPAASNLPSGTATVGAGRITLSLTGLRALTGGQYQFWVMGRDSLNRNTPVQIFGTVVEFYRRPDTLPDGSVNLNPITGDTIFVTDSTPISTIRAAGYAGSDNSQVTSVRVIADSSADLTNPTTYNAVFVTMETAPATSPGSARFLWRRIGSEEAKENGVSGSMLFGNFAGLDFINLQSPNDYVFRPLGSGIGGARGPELSVDLSELARPPVGFFYRGYLVDAQGNIGAVVDTLRSAWSRDQTVNRVSMFDADVDNALPNVVGDEIRASQIRNCAIGSAVNNCQNAMDLPVDGTFTGLETFQLKLEPKGGVAPSRNKSVTLTGALPKQVK
jgi:hypothetical protein